MSTSLKAALTSLIAAIALTAALGTATANRLRISEQEIEAIWQPLTFTTGGSVNVRCNVTLLGRLHSSTIIKAEGSLIGYVNHVRVQRPCTGGTAWAYNGEEVNEALGGTLGNSLPWHIVFDGFGGSLPNISTINIWFLGARFLTRATILGITLLCSYGTSGTQPFEAIAIVGSGVITQLAANSTAAIGRTAESNRLCPAINFSGTGTVTNLAGTSSITVTLV